ncbi:uncharacterized protein [Clytia hemisphaerica]|uniref:uncharacterized protein n=1 Tax=Clytia hemisphaerica TaxID=252671 RepID=UPI0034D413F1
MRFWIVVQLLLPISIVVCKDGVEKHLFPLLQFYGEHTTHAIGSNPFLYFSLIDNYLCSGEKTDKTHCSCKPSCVNRVSCCIDYFWNDRTHWVLREYIDYYLSKQSKDVKCMKIADVSSPKVDRVYIVTGCSKWNKLRLGTGFQPVVDESNVVYKNPSIAQCHGADSLKPISIEIGCNSTMNAVGPNSSPEGHNECSYKVLNNPDLPYCGAKNPCDSAKSQNKGNSIHKTNNDLCQSYNGVIKIQESATRSETFRNIHCSKCSSIKPEKLIIPLQNIAITPQIPMSHSVTIDYGTTGVQAYYNNKGQKLNIDYQCSNEELYDVTQKQCLPFLCGHGYERIGASCRKERKDNSTNTDMDSEDNKIDHLLSCIFSSNERGVVYLNTSVDQTLTYQNTEEIKRDKNTIMYGIRVQKPEDIQAFMSGLIKNKTDIPSQEITLSTYSPYIKTHLKGIALKRGFPDMQMCREEPIELKNTSSYNMKGNCSLNKGNRKLPYGTYLTEIKISLKTSINQQQMKYRIYTCQKFYLNSPCPRKEIDLSDRKYKWLENGTIDLGRDGVYLGEQYIPTRKGVSVCIQDYITGRLADPDPTWFDQAQEAIGYLTLVCCVISIPSYIYVIIVYTKAKELRTIPGKNIVCICIALLLSDVLILTTSIADKKTMLCGVIASLLHYGLLSAHAWSAIIAFEIWTTFKKGKTRSTLTFLYYCIIGFGAPLIPVITMSFLDRYQVLSIGYGRDICWIGDQTYRVFLYLIPIVVISLFDIAVISFVLTQIYIQQRRSSQLLNKATETKETTVLKTAMKLVFLLGLVELIGFIQLPRGEETWKAVLHIIIQFVYVTLRGFRGLFIWVMYVYMNERAWKYRTCRQNNSYSPKESPVTTMTRRSNGATGLTHKTSFRVTQTLGDDVHIVKV